MGSADAVRSPSFTLSNQYKAGELTLYHYDFHRLQEPGIMREELAELLTDPKAVIVIEWADIIEDILPAERITIQIIPTGETGRRLVFQAPIALRDRMS